MLICVVNIKLLLWQKLEPGVEFRLGHALVTSLFGGRTEESAGYTGHKMAGSRPNPGEVGQVQALLDDRERSTPDHPDLKRGSTRYILEFAGYTDDEDRRRSALGPNPVGTWQNQGYHLELSHSKMEE